MKNKIYFVPLYYYLTYPDFKQYNNDKSITSFYDLKVLNVTYNDLNLPYLENKDIKNNIENLCNISAKKNNSFTVLISKLKRIKNHLASHQNKLKVLMNFIFIYLLIIYSLPKNTSVINDILLNFIFVLLVYVFLLIIYKKIKTALRSNKEQKYKRASIKVYNKIYEYLKKQAPKMMIFSSDLGDVNIRLTILAANMLDIPVVIYWMGDIEKNNLDSMTINSEKSTGYKGDFFEMAFDNALKFNEHYFNIIGSYSKNARIFVAHSIAKTKLIQEGISEDRITVIEYKPFENYNCSNNIKGKYIVYYTENLNSILGKEYINNLHISLNKDFERLHQQTGVTTIVRPHPMERNGTEEYFQLEKIFKAKGVILDYKYSLEELALKAEINIGHFSKVLLDTLLSGGNILSINTINNSDLSFIPKNEYQLLKVSSYENILEKINYFISDDIYKNNYIKEQKRLKHYLTKDASKFNIEIEKLIKECEVKHNG